MIPSKIWEFSQTHLGSQLSSFNRKFRSFCDFIAKITMPSEGMVLGSHFWKPQKIVNEHALARKSPCLLGKSCMMNGRNSCCKAIRSVALLIFWTAICQSISSTISYLWWTRENSMWKYWKVLHQVKMAESKHCMSCETTNHSATRERIMLSWIADWHSIFVRIPNRPMISSDP